MCVERLAHGKQGIFSRILFWKKGGGGGEGGWERGQCEVASALAFKSICSFTSQKCPSLTRIALLFFFTNLIFLYKKAPTHDAFLKTLNLYMEYNFWCLLFKF